MYMYKYRNRFRDKDEQIVTIISTCILTPEAKGMFFTFDSESARALMRSDRCCFHREKPHNMQNNPITTRAVGLVKLASQ